jgi:hypothetical protein
MEIKVPKRLSDTTLKQVWWFANYCANNPAIALQQRLEVVSYFSGISVEKLKSVDAFQINEIFAHLVKMFNTEQAAPPEIITVKGKTYTFRGKKLKAGQFIDWECSDKSPETLAAICYVEQGEDYGAVDADGLYYNTLDIRAAIFREHMQGDVYYHLSTFFLHTWEKLQGIILVREKNMMRLLKKKLDVLNGTRQ